MTESGSESTQDKTKAPFPTGRVGVMVTWLVRHRDEIEDAQKGELYFFFSGTSVVPKLSRLEEPIRVE